MKLLYASMALFLMLFSNVATAATIPSNGVLDFTVVRKGKDIGHHTMHFEKDGGKTKITIKTKIKTKMLFIPAYKFNHDAVETWENGSMTYMHSKTNDDGKKHRIDMSKQGMTIFIKSDGNKGYIQKGNILPASLWNNALVKQNKVLNTLDGRVMSIVPKNMGMENIIVRGQEVIAEHYKIMGDFERDLWYTPGGLLVKVQFKGDDGEQIQYILK